MPTGINIFKDLHEHKGVIQSTRNSIIDMSRIANVLGEVVGDKVYFDDITGVNLQEQDSGSANECGNADFSCLGSDRAEMTLDKLIDATYILKSCRVNRLASLSSQDANTIIGQAVSKFDFNQMILEATNHMKVVSTALNNYTATENGIYEIIEGMVTKVEVDNATSVSSITRGMDIVVALSPKASSLVRTQKLGCCELLGSDLSAVENAWGVKDVVSVPANIMPAGVDIMVYVVDWALFGYACRDKSVYDGMSEQTRNYKVMQLFEEYGSKVVSSTEFTEIVKNPGEKFSFITDTEAPVISGDTTASFGLTDNIDFNMPEAITTFNLVATDNVDGDITNSIVLASNTDNLNATGGNTAGVYTLTYTVTDNAGNTSDAHTVEVTVA